MAEGSSANTKAVAAYQGGRAADVAARLRAAMAAIEAERSAPRESGEPRWGRVTRKDVCDRAGVGESTPKNPAHAELRVEMDAWAKRMSDNASAPVRAAQAAATRDALRTTREGEFKLLAFRYNEGMVAKAEAEQRLSDAEHLLAARNLRIAELESELAGLRRAPP